MKTLTSIQRALAACRDCSQVCGTPVHGESHHAQVMLIGQAPGPHEARLGKPFAHSAGRTLFSWLHQATGLDEADLRQQFYFAAVARCFPGKNPKGGGDREPSIEEIENCRRFLKAEVEVLRPRLVLAVGKLAIREVLGPKIFKKSSKLDEVIGKVYSIHFHGQPVQVIPLPHPSGISTWHKRGRGKELLELALLQIKQLEKWRTRQESNL
jgi:uracil-DNA glycosylase